MRRSVSERGEAAQTAKKALRVTPFRLQSFSANAVTESHSRGTSHSVFPRDNISTLVWQSSRRRCLVGWKIAFLQGGNELERTGQVYMRSTVSQGLFDPRWLH